MIAYRLLNAQTQAGFQEVPGPKHAARVFQSSEQLEWRNRRTRRSLVITAVAVYRSFVAYSAR